MFYVLNLIAYMRDRIDTAKDRGATATEYALLVAFIAVAISFVVWQFGSQLSTFFSDLGHKAGIVDGGDPSK